MREIKFRTWDEYNKKMIDADDTLVKCLDIGCQSMQYTGLKDKNGKEIYEGDLLKATTEYLNKCGAKTYDNYRETNYALYEVFFHDNDCCDNHVGFQIDRRRSYGADGEIQFNPKLRPYYAKNMEVIGNIYENPELLERSDD